jgi:hypothetical protein
MRKSVRNMKIIMSDFVRHYDFPVKISRSITLPIISYGCETWSLTLREERRLRVFENRLLRRTFGLKSDEVTGEWRKLHNEELHVLYSSPTIEQVIKPRRMRLAGNVVHMGRGAMCTGFWWGNLWERDHLGDTGIDGKIILRWIFRKWDVGVWTGLSWPRTDRWRALVNAVMNFRVP